MRTLYVSKYLGYWSVRYLKNGAHPAWPLSSLAIKTHGVISYPDMVFITEDEAVEYAKDVAEKINYSYSQPYCNILIEGVEGSRTRNIEHTKAVAVDVAHVDFKPPSTEINQFGRIKGRK
jgi:hypothetical protein